MPKQRATRAPNLQRDVLRLNEYMGQTPTPFQISLMSFWGMDAFAGGAGGPGKTSGLLLVGLQGITEPGHAVGFFRKTYTALTASKGPMDRLDKWLRNTKAQWIGWKHQWQFPGSAIWTFGSLQDKESRDRIAGSEYNTTLIDESTQLTPDERKFVMSRLRQGTDPGLLPLRNRHGGNPGGPGHEDLKVNYVDKYEKAQRGERVEDTVVDMGDGIEVRMRWGIDTAFFPGRLKDNAKHLNFQSYVRSIAHLPKVLRERILRGDWTIQESGDFFVRADFGIIEALPANVVRGVRAWDMAASIKEPGKDPDWTVGLKAWRTGDDLIVFEHMARFRERPMTRDSLMKQAAEGDGKELAIVEEQEGGSSGPSVIDAHGRMLTGWNYRGISTAGKAIQKRAEPYAALVEQKRVKLVAGDWNQDFLDEHAIFFTEGQHDDIVSAGSLAVNYLCAEDGLGGVAAYYAELAKEANAGR